MESLISLIVVGVIIFNIVRSTNKGKSPGNSNRPQMPPPVRNNQQPRPQQGKSNEWNLSRSLTERKVEQEKKTEMYSEADKALIEKGKQQSTTEYLKQKADFDEKEHNREREQQQEKQKDYERGSGLITAERLIMGDSIPNDRRVLKCKYCGAENLVPVNIRSKYGCYFCREIL